MTIKRGFKKRPYESGNVTLVFALSGVALVGMIGGGIEITRVVDGRAKLQSALDAGALAAAGMAEGTSNSIRETTANKVVAANLQIGRGIVPNSLAIIPNFEARDRVALSGEVKLETILGKSMFGGFHTIRAQSTAQKATLGSPAIPATVPTPNCPAQPAPTDAPAQVSPPSPPPTSPPPSPPPPPATAQGCIWALNPGSVNGFLFNSGNKITAPNCQFHDHATGGASVMFNSGNGIEVNKLFTKGTITNNAGANLAALNFVESAGSLVLNDPYASGLPQPNNTLCAYNDRAFNGAVTLSPGTYCGWQNFNANGATVTLSPGLYIVRGGGWNINQGIVQATGGVTIYFEDNSRWHFNSNSQINLTAPSSGPYAGLAMYEKYGMGNETRPIDATGGLQVTGLLYFPSKDLIFNSGSNIANVSTRIVGRTINFSGTNWKLAPYTGALPPGVTNPGGASPPPPATSPPPPPLPPVSTGSGLLSNGSFEMPVSPIGTVTPYTIAQGVSGWTSSQGFEIHNSHMGSGYGGFGTDGVQYAELRKDLSQTVTLAAGKSYQFQFDYRYGDNGSSNDNHFLVNWGNKQLADVQPVSGAGGSSAVWKRLTFPIRGTGSPITITFTQLLGSDYFRSAFLDRVRVYEVDTNPNPPDGCPGAPPLPPPPPPTPAVSPTPLRIIR